MKVKDLIKELQRYPEYLNVDCNDGHGTYSDIKEVKEQLWTDRDGYNYDTVTIVHDGYTESDAKVISEDIKLVPEATSWVLNEWNKVLEEQPKQQETPVKPEEDQSKPEPVPPLKIGDIVKIIACTDKRDEPIFLNRVGTIEQIWSGNKFGEYCVVLPNGCSNCFFGNQIEPVASTYE